MENNKKDALTLFGMSNSEFGKALIESAQSDNKKQFIEQAKNEVKRMLDDMEKIRLNTERNNRFLSLYTRRLEAIEKGEFTFKGSKIEYTNDELNKEPN